MPKKKTELQKAIGKLISEIQKHWGDEIHQVNADFSFNVMDSAHDLLQARTPEKVRELLGPLTVAQYLGEVWVQGHPSVKAKIFDVENLLIKDEVYRPTDQSGQSDF